MCCCKTSGPARSNAWVSAKTPCARSIPHHFRVHQWIWGKRPYSHKRVYDPIIQGLSGATDISGRSKNGTPQHVRVILADKVSALTAAQAISSALFHRERSGEGQHIRLSMLEATIAFLWPEGMSGLTFADQQVDIRKTFSSIDLIYETADGHITISVISDKEWKGICEALGREDLIEDERFCSALARRKIRICAAR